MLVEVQRTVSVTDYRWCS